MSRLLIYPVDPLQPPANWALVGPKHGTKSGLRV